MEFLGIDFSGNARSWHSRLATSNVWVCRVKCGSELRPDVTQLHPSERMGELIEFMDAQKARTPKGIDQIKHFLARKGRLVSNNTAIMGFLMQRRKVNCTVWAEAVWEIFSAKKSAVKFLLSDDPVLIYNCD